MIVKVRSNVPADRDAGQVRFVSVEDRRQQICTMIAAVPQLEDAMAGDDVAFFAAKFFVAENRLEIGERVRDRSW